VGFFRVAELARIATLAARIVHQRRSV